MIEETEQPIEQPTYVPIRVIETHGKSALIERVDDYRRYMAPIAKVGDREIDAAELEKCPLYGIPWERYLGLEDVTADAIAFSLRKVGIYTLADLQARDRQLIRIGTNLIGRVVRDAAERADAAKPPRRQKNAK